MARIPMIRFLGPRHKLAHASSPAAATTVQSKPTTTTTSKSHNHTIITYSSFAELPQWLQKGGRRPWTAQEMQAIDSGGAEVEFDKAKCCMDHRDVIYRPSHPIPSHKTLRKPEINTPFITMPTVVSSSIIQTGLCIQTTPLVGEVPRVRVEVQVEEGNKKGKKTETSRKQLHPSLPFFNQASLVAGSIEQSQLQNNHLLSTVQGLGIYLYEREAEGGGRKCVNAWLVPPKTVFAVPAIAFHSIPASNSKQDDVEMKDAVVEDEGAYSTVPATKDAPCPIIPVTVVDEELWWWNVDGTLHKIPVPCQEHPIHYSCVLHSHGKSNPNQAIFVLKNGHSYIWSAETKSFLNPSSPISLPGMGLEHHLHWITLSEGQHMYAAFTSSATSKSNDVATAVNKVIYTMFDSASCTFSSPINVFCEGTKNEFSPVAFATHADQLVMAFPGVLKLYKSGVSLSMGRPIAVDAFTLQAQTPGSFELVFLDGYVGLLMSSSSPNADTLHLWECTFGTKQIEKILHTSESDDNEMQQHIKVTKGEFADLGSSLIISRASVISSKKRSTFNAQDYVCSYHLPVINLRTAFGKLAVSPVRIKTKADDAASLMLSTTNAQDFEAQLLAWVQAACKKMRQPIPQSLAEANGQILDISASLLHSLCVKAFAESCNSASVIRFLVSTGRVSCTCVDDPSSILEFAISTKNWPLCEVIVQGVSDISEGEIVTFALAILSEDVSSLSTSEKHRLLGVVFDLPRNDHFMVAALKRLGVDSTQAILHWVATEMLGVDLVARDTVDVLTVMEGPTSQEQRDRACQVFELLLDAQFGNLILSKETYPLLKRLQHFLRDYQATLGSLDDKIRGPMLMLEEGAAEARRIALKAEEVKPEAPEHGKRWKAMMKSYQGGSYVVETLRLPL